MASYYIRKDSPFYWIKTIDAMGLAKSKSSGVRHDGGGSLRKIHQKVAEASMKEQRLKIDGNKACFQSWVPGWIESYYPNTLTVNRALNCWSWLSLYLKDLKIQHPEEVTYRVCQDYMKWRSDPAVCSDAGRRCAKWNTALLEVRFLGSIMQEAMARDLCSFNPCARLRLGRRNTKEKHEITAEEQAVIEKEIVTHPQWMRDSWVVGIKQGCRISEVQVPFDMIDERNDVIAFRTKGGKVHAAPMHAAVKDVYLRRKAEGEKTLVDLPSNASKHWCEFLAKIKLPHLSFHCARVSVVTRLARAGASEAKTMQYVGHCSHAVHAVYRKLRPADVKALGDML